MEETSQLPIPWNLLILLGAGIGALLVLTMAILILARLFRRRPQPVAEVKPPPPIRLDQIRSDGPEEGVQPQVELHGLPVRIALIVVAPAGRVQVAPSGDALASMLEYILPGMEEIVRRDEPQILRWPAQLSSSGFSQTFFTSAKLPGEQGKGSRYSAVAGKLEARGSALLIGFIFCSDKVNALGQEMADHEGQWRDLLRVRRG